jgi:hypothetical protein
MQTHGRFKGGEEVANGVESEVFEDGRHKNILKRDGYWTWFVGWKSFIGLYRSNTGMTNKSVCT